MDVLAVKGNQELVSERITQKVREVIKHRNARKRTLKRVKNTEKRLESNRKRLSFSAGGNDSTSFNKERCSANSSGVIVANNQEIYGFPTLPKVSQFKIPKKVALSKDSSATSPISRSDKEKKCSPLKLLSHPLVLKNVKHLTKQSKLQNADSRNCKDTRDEHFLPNHHGTPSVMEYVESWLNTSVESDTFVKLTSERNSELNYTGRTSPMVIDSEEPVEAVKDIQRPNSPDSEKANDSVKSNLKSSHDVLKADRNSIAIYVVVDTNILAHHLTIVDDIKKAWNGEDASDTVIIIIPWIVFQELDSLKDDKSDKSPELKTMASTAVKYLYELLSKRNPQVKGQTIAESLEDVGWPIKCNDDSILHCCLQCKAKEFEVLLLTNDCNLRNKAIVNNIKAYSSDTITKGLDKISPLPPEKKKLMGIIWEGNPNTGSTLCNDILQDIKNELHSILETVLKTEMYSAYGRDMWLKIVAIQPPWRLVDILKCLQKYDDTLRGYTRTGIPDRHWIAVFGQVVDRKAHDHLNILCDKFKVVQGSFKKEDLKALLVASLRFLMFFNGRPNYKDRIISSIHKIRNYLDRVKTDMLNDHQTKSPVQATEDSPLSSFKVLEKNSSSLPLTTVTETPSTNIGENVCMMKELQSNEESIQTPVVEIFNDIWGFIHQACGMIYDSFNLTNPIHYDRRGITPTSNDSLQFIPRFFPLLTKLKAHTESVLRLSSDAGPESDDYRKLCCLLTHFFFYLDLAPELDVEEEKISPEMLHRFCRNPKTREMLQRGLYQLEELCVLLYQCALTIKDCHLNL